MKILFVSQYYPPEMGAPSARVSELTSYWAGQGHYVTVLTGFPNHPTGKIHPAYVDKFKNLIYYEHNNGVNVLRTWLYPAPNRKPWERILNYSSFGLSACLRGMVLSDFDIVIGTSPQLLAGFAGWWLGSLYRRPFVLEIRDIWPESLLASGIGRENSLLIKTLKQMSIFLYENCSRIVVVTRAFKDLLVNEYKIPQEKLSVVENGVEIDKFHPFESNSLNSYLKSSGNFIVAYIGTIGFAHGLDFIFKAANHLKNKEECIKFVLIGEGALKETMKKKIEKEHISNVFVLDQVPYPEIPQYINSCDVMLVSLRKSELFKTVIPSKMLEFMACARPVILSVDGQAREILESAKGGIYIEPENYEQLVSAVLKLYKDPELRVKLGQNGRNYVIKNFNRQQKAIEYLNILKEVVDSYK